MRLVIDLQAAQGCNKDRGIGRYALALARALTSQATGHEVWIALNDAFPDTIEPLRAAFDTLLPQERIVVWQAPGPAAGADVANDWRRNAAELLREAFLESLEPELVYVPSLFEGIVDDAATSVGRIVEGRRTGVAIHDLIPLAERDHYLADPAIEAAYQRKLVSIRRAGLWCPVSEWTRRAAMEQLGLPAEKLIVVPNAADRRFRPMEIGGDAAESLLRRFGITRPFVMYTAGTDPRKNVERLIGAFARLPEGLRARHQLVLVCAADAMSARGFKELAARRGLAGDELILTGFVSDDDLVQLYNLCRTFCFPSLSEGFGMPALEAMQCGAPTISADVTGIPEVVGCVDALFDPRNEDEISARLTQVLADESYRASLIRHGRAQARKFSWKDSAARAWAAFAEQHREAPRGCGRRLSAPSGGRPRLAYVSPLPPEKSGISDYSVELLPELARHYDIDVIASDPPVADPSVSANYPQRTVAWFARNAHRYDRILYHFGNSVFHRHMFDLAVRYPGIVVLHDFYLSGVIAHMDQHDGRTGYWAQSLYESHGYRAIQDLQGTADGSEIVWRYPANLALLQHAAGVIVHSEFARALAAQHYGRAFVAEWVVLPQLFRLPQRLPRQPARAALGFSERDFIVCSVGVMGPAKLNHRLLEAWLNSDFALRGDCHLVFVGEDPDGGYAERLSRMIVGSPSVDRVHITGFAKPAVYRQY
ncbi:MAG: glycosyltransferase, partial [Acetobacteraceae bacterium]